VPVATIAILQATRPPAFLRDSGETYKDAFYSSLTTSAITPTADKKVGITLAVAGIFGDAFFGPEFERSHQGVLGPVLLRCRYRG
jgi:hypothetical protein